MASPWLLWEFAAAPGGTWVVLTACLLMPLLARWTRHARMADRHRRGALVKVACRRLRLGAGELSQTARLQLGGVAIAVGDEVKHFKLIGTTGTGKSTAIRQLLGAALRRGDRAVVSDPEGTYLRQLGRRYRGDVVLNPFDPDSVRWDLFAELQTDYDIEQLASALIANSADPSTQEWRGYARTFFSAVTRRCRDVGITDLPELWRLLAVAPHEELRALVAGTAAQPFLEPDNARMFGSIRSVTVAAVAALEFVKAQRSVPFSVRAWVRGARGALFIPYRATQIAALRSMVSAWIRLAIFEAMDRGADVDQHLWFIVDELDALGPIEGLKDALARLRKFGGRCVLGLQSIAQVSSTYGHGDAQTIVENCANTLILRCAGSEQGGTSQFASRLIGEREVMRRQRSRGHDGGGPFTLSSVRRSTQISEQQIVEPAVLAAELEQLPDLVGYLRTASSRHWTRIRLAR
jgi:type IV secretory pathway TraG/TraD family ATPase VirD4